MSETAHPQRSWTALLRSGTALLFWSLVAVLVVASLLPSSTMAELRHDWHGFGTLMNHIEALPLPLDTTHALLFALLAATLAARVTLRLRGVVVVLATTLLLSGATELLQLWAPGRRSDWRDIRDDMIGAVVGLFAVFLLRHMRRWIWPHHVREDLARSKIVSLLRGEAELSWPEDETSQRQLLDCARHERVVALVDQRLSAQAAPDSLRSMFSSAAHDAAARSLLRESEVRRITRVLHEQGIDHLWLKGMALTAWLYPSRHLRDCADLDLLLPSHALALHAADALVAIDYQLVRRHIAGDLFVYELLAVCSRHGLELDLHWRLANTALYAERLSWPELRATAIDLGPAFPGALGLSPIHAFLNACMHWASNRLLRQSGRLHWLYDLHLLVQHFDSQAWREVVALASSRRLASTCLGALSECNEVFATPVPTEVRRLLAGCARSQWLRPAYLQHWGYFQFANLRELPDYRARWRWLQQMLVGSAEHRRERYGADGAGALRVLGRRLRDGLHRFWTHASR